MKKRIQIIFFFLLLSQTNYSQWYQQNSGTLNNLFDVSFADANYGIIVCDSYIIKTTNGGLTWTIIVDSGPYANYTGVCMTDTNSITVLGYDYNGDGFINKSTDGGVTWNNQYGNPGSKFYDISYSDSINGTVVGNGLTILRTTNSGSNWIQQLSGIYTLNGVSFSDSITGNAVGENGTILRTTNGGQSWISQTSGTTRYLFGVSFTDVNNGTAVGEYGTILRTTNSGTNWNEQLSGTINTLRGVYFTDTNIGTTVGDIGTILGTTNGGTNWTLQPSGTAYNLRSVYFTDVNTGTVVGEAGTILRTTDSLSIDSSLIAYYPFNGNTNDESGYYNHGTIVGGASLTTDRFGNSNSSIHFNGIDGYILVPNSTSLQSPTSEITLAGWINIEGFPSIAVAGLIMKTISNTQGEFGLGYAESPTGNIYYIQNGISPAYTSLDLALNKWHFIASTFDGDSVKIYCNGNYISSSAFSSPIISDNNPLVLGLESNGNSEYLLGKLDDIRIYNRALSETELNTLYQEGGWGDLVAYYPFNGNANDESGYGNHGTVYGATLTTDRFGRQDSSYYINGGYIDCGNPLNNTLDLGANATINAWVKLDPGNSGGIIVGKDESSGSSNKYFFQLGGNGQLIFHINQPSSGNGAWMYSNTWELIPSRWYFVSLVKIGLLYYFYVNGIPFGTAVSWLEVPDVNAPFLIGTAESYGYSGLLDDISFYNRALSPLEIDSLYHLGGWPLTTFELAVSVTDGWNMVSAPGLHPVDQNVATWWPNKTGTVWGFNGSQYVSRTVTTPGEGYWMKNTVAETYNYPAITIVPHNPIPATLGWNMLGGNENSPTITALKAINPQITGTVWGFNGSQYVSATNLVPGYSYWVKVTTAGDITIPDIVPKSSGGEIELFKEDWGRIILTDAAGLSYTLYAVKGQVDLSQYEMPPLPPAGMFDIRFSSGRIAEDINSSIQTIDMVGITYPLTVRVEGMDIRLQDATGKALNQNLKSGEDMVISDATIQKLMVTSELIPTVYALEQNYPNPFNPSTMIEFSLPENVGNVKLSIYNALGEKVAELVNTALVAGKYNYQWNAQNVATGMYIYELRTDKFVSVKKMILLK